jgi:hypothetical protein
MAGREGTGGRKGAAERPSSSPHPLPHVSARPRRSPSPVPSRARPSSAQTHTFRPVYGRLCVELGGGSLPAEELLGPPPIPLGAEELSDEELPELDELLVVGLVDDGCGDEE